MSRQEYKDNWRKKEGLIQLLSSGEGILMAGAGCTSSLYPDWAAFIQLLHKAALQREEGFPPYDDSVDNFLNYADKVKACIGNKLFHNSIFQHFKPREKTHERFHEILCRFLLDGKLKGITTTNYDMVFESALASVKGDSGEAVRLDTGIAPAKIFEFLFSLNNGSVPKRILHWHGTYDVPASLILSASEYQENYGFKLNKPSQPLFEAVKGGITEEEFISLLTEFGLVWTRHRKIIWSLFATRRLIFMGFSFTDPYFKQMLETISEDLHSYGYDNHFLVQRIKSPEEKYELFKRAKALKDGYGIETVFFEETATENGLSNFIFELEQGFQNIAASSSDVALEVPVISDQNNSDNDLELTERLIELSKQR